MPRKIFISYRRDDSAGSALSIAQYLEHEFGRKNVFIDVDMRAGTKFPEVLEARLAECKVMLVIVGPGWLAASDDQGGQRLQRPDDWVRLEVAQALQRNITVIPVRVNGAPLPPRGALPQEIRGLLDHQAISVTHAGFRHEMLGLARDIRAIPSPRTWRRPVAIAAGVGSLVVAGLALWHLVHASTQNSRSLSQNEFWTSPPGEWVLFATNNQVPAIPYYFQSSSVTTLADAVIYTARAPLKSSNTPASSNSNLPEPAYQDERSLIDCKKSTYASLERTAFNKSGEIISRVKLSDSQTAPSPGTQIDAGSIASVAKHLLCGNLKIPVLTKEHLTNLKLSFIARTPKGDGNIYHGQPERISDSSNEFELLTLLRFDADHAFSEVISGNAIGLPRSYRSFGQRLRINCTDRKLQSFKLDHFDADGNWLYAYVAPTTDPIAASPGSVFAQLITLACGAVVTGTYEGINHSVYKRGAQGEQKISLIVEQTGDQVKVTFRTPLGDSGSGVGTLVGRRVEAMSLQSTEGGSCPGSYSASIEFIGETAKWFFKGQDCTDAMEGNGTATRVAS